ncbi:MAG: hypothetical protein OQL07_11120 [Gammaproteobacteria bacterium]|nr:hypothetical protein [Gammaproteobacteria bacterium]
MGPEGDDAGGKVVVEGAPGKLIKAWKRSETEKAIPIPIIPAGAGIQNRRMRQTKQGQKDLYRSKMYVIDLMIFFLYSIALA